MKRSILLLLLSVFALSGYSQNKGTEKILAKAEDGNAKAQYRIGWYYGNGAKGFERNELKAIEWLEKSAENNNKHHREPAEKTKTAERKKIFRTRARFPANNR